MTAPEPVALVIADLGPGGAQRVVCQLAAAWAESGRTVTVITLDGGERDFWPLDRQVARRALGVLGESRSLAGAMASNVARLRALRRAIRQCPAQTVIAFVGTTNILTVLAAVGLGKRVIVSERNDPARQSLGRVWDWLRRRVYRHADLVTANSKGALEAMRAYVPRSKLAVVPNLLVLPEEIVPVPAQAPTILTVGRLARQKGYDLLLRAFASTQARQTGWRLAALGEGPLAEALAAQAEALGIAGQVEWRGRSARPFDHYAAAAVFVLASRHEGTPNALLEAMAMGLPAIVTEACGGALDYVEAEVSGLVVPAEDPDALGRAIDRLAQDEALRRRLGQAGRARVEACKLERAMPAWNAILKERQESAPAAQPIVQAGLNGPASQRAKS